jgi:hypothetical protein
MAALPNGGRQEWARKRISRATSFLQMEQTARKQPVAEARAATFRPRSQLHKNFDLSGYLSAQKIGLLADLFIATSSWQAWAKDC